jgi:hypothetical protein
LPSDALCAPVAVLFVMVTLASFIVSLVDSAPPPKAVFPENVESTASNSAPLLAPAKTAPPLAVAELSENVQPRHAAWFSTKIAPPSPPLAAVAWLWLSVVFVMTVCPA